VRNKEKGSLWEERAKYKFTTITLEQEEKKCERRERVMLNYDRK
jgi:hypothetical protein